ELLYTFNESVIWIDMCKVFEQEPIVIKGAYRFKLKQIGNAFYNNGLISTKWEDGQMSDGLIVMLEMIKLYRTDQTMSPHINKFKSVIDYNEVDCRVVWEIINYLRAN